MSCRQSLEFHSERENVGSFEERSDVLGYMGYTLAAMWQQSVGRPEWKPEDYIIRRLL